MKRLLIAASMLFAFSALPVFAQQNEAEAKQEVEPNAIWSWLNFAILAGGLGYMVKKNAGPYFAQRSLEIRKGMLEADEARAEADAKVADVDRRLAALPGEIEKLKREAKSEAEAEAERVRRDALQEIAKIQSHLAEEIASAGKAARLELRRYSASLAIDLAERKIAARMSPAIQDQLVAAFAAHLEDPAAQVRNN
jgi:F-type H+-transporting ATPase subunit b